MILLESWDWCDEKDKSTEFMLLYMSDRAGVDYDTVVDFVSDDKVNEYRQSTFK